MFVISFDYTYNEWAKSHFTLLKANKTKRNEVKNMGYISNERRKL